MFLHLSWTVIRINSKAFLHDVLLSCPSKAFKLLFSDKFKKIVASINRCVSKQAEKIIREIKKKNYLESKLTKIKTIKEETSINLRFLLFDPQELQKGKEVIKDIKDKDTDLQIEWRS